MIDIKVINNVKEYVKEINALFIEWNSALSFSPHDNIIGFLAYKADKIVGMGFLSVYHRTPSTDCLKGKIGEMCSIYVSPLYRKQGIATEIVKQIIKKGKELQLDYIHTDATIKASTIYLNSGFISQSQNECRLWFPYFFKEDKYPLK